MAEDLAIDVVAFQSLWVHLRAMLNVPTVLAFGRGLFAAGVPRFKLIFGLDM